MTGNKKTSSSSQTDRKSQCVLVIADDHSILSYISILLTRFDYLVLKAATGQEGLTKAARLVPSLIIIALDIPDIGTFELMRKLKQTRGTSPVPLIALINNNDSDLKERCHAHGAVSCVSQPVEAESLYKTVQAAIEKNPRSRMRVRAVLPVKVHSMPHHSLYGAYTLTLSTGGMFLRTMNPVSVNSEISLEFDLNGRAIAAETVVIYNCQSGCGPELEGGIGLRFVDISTKDEDVIREFIKSEIMKGLSTAGNPPVV